MTASAMQPRDTGKEGTAAMVEETLCAFNSDLYAEVAQWLTIEAQLLDDRLERQWLETMVSRDVSYVMPMRQTTFRTEGYGFLDDMYHLQETYGSLETKVARNETGSAWAEDPPSRFRHFVSNIRAYQRSDGGFGARSALLLYRMRGDQHVPTLISGERRDILQRIDGRLKLLRREILLDHTVIAAENLAIFF